jgi:Tol biopolymer transport system component
VEVPGWTHDGRALIYNSVGSREVRGRLYRLNLLSGEQVAIDTGSVTGITNHVLAPNGTTVAVTEYSTGQAAISTVPVDGGAGRRITSVAPSYLHGWSPDGKFLVYTGRRDGEFDVYKIPADGSGPEIRLTNSPGMDDGADYTADGKFIYFNSLRSGRMQIWRMRPDGSDQEQVTDDEYNNWWPHPSPDGRWLVMLSYGADVAPGSHPYYRHVYLRLMPLAGGTPTVIAYVYGGQGSINVPSWSPDSRRIAFMSNSGPLSP